MRRGAFFDCDSTLSAVEGIDLLARRANVAAQVVPLTKAAMEGSLPLEQVYAQRLELIRPARADVTWLGAQYVEQRAAGAAETVAALHALGWQVHIISSGIREAVLALAADLCIPPECVHAVAVHFDAAGAYRDFDRASPLTRAGGKAAVCRWLMARLDRAVMIGDGVTDLEAAEANVPVVGYGGIARRERVAAQAWRYVDAPSLTAVLDVILGPADHARLAGQSGTPKP
ncbi:MAG: Phosphoserine phosphatase [Gammaproteobacteria bacterium]|nr:Phosphoserine phosphatase [Gammaproteobacteria bacterium]